MKLLKPTLEIVTLLEQASQWLKKMHDDGDHQHVRITLSLLISDIMDRSNVRGVEGDLTSVVSRAFDAILELHTFEGEVKDDA